MFATLLITFREVIEAALIVATILGILAKLHQYKSMWTVWVASICAFIVSFALLVAGSLVGAKAQQIYTQNEALIEGLLMVTSAIFITWAVFFLHNYFGRYKTTLLSKIRTEVEKEEQKGLFFLVFTAVFREGIEIVLFLSTVYFSSSPIQVFSGFFLGTLCALGVSYGLFHATIRLPVFYAFKITSMLLILFAGGLLAHGVSEFGEVGIMPDAHFFRTGFYIIYVGFMVWWVFLRTKIRHAPKV